MNQVFVDTRAFAALADKDDDNHAKAKHLPLTTIFPKWVLFVVLINLKVLVLWQLAITNESAEP